MAVRAAFQCGPGQAEIVMLTRVCPMDFLGFLTLVRCGNGLWADRHFSGVNGLLAPAEYAGRAQAFQLQAERPFALGTELQTAYIKINIKKQIFIILSFMV